MKWSWLINFKIKWGHKGKVNHWNSCRMKWSPPHCGNYRHSPWHQNHQTHAKSPECNKQNSRDRCWGSTSWDANWAALSWQGGSATTDSKRTLAENYTTWKDMEKIIPMYCRIFLGRWVPCINNVPSDIPETNLCVLKNPNSALIFFETSHCGGDFCALFWGGCFSHLDTFLPVFVGSKSLVLQHLHQFGDASDTGSTLQVCNDGFGGGQNQLILVCTVLQRSCRGST